MRWGMKSRARTSNKSRVMLTQDHTLRATGPKSKDELVPKVPAIPCALDVFTEAEVPSPALGHGNWVLGTQRLIAHSLTQGGGESMSKESPGSKGHRPT